jgi:hypothetical protein
VTRGVIMALALVVAGAAPIQAQTAPPAAPAGGVEFLSRFDFSVGLDHLVSDDPRFVWDANFGGELDMIDYRSGRATFVANYQTILGSQFRAFDPNQGNYILEGFVSQRRGAWEVAGVFHHVSRHLSDRPKRFPVDWNMIGGRILGTATRGRTALRGRVDLRGVIQNTYVDYRWELESDVAARVTLRPRVAFVTSGTGRVVGVDGTVDRGTQYGYRGEAGVRLEGRRALLDLLIAVERRIDAYQLEFSTATWMTVGFRISSPSWSRMP